MPNLNRRVFLAAIAAIGLAGCTTGDDDENGEEATPTATPSPTPTPESTPTPTPGGPESGPLVSFSDIDVTAYDPDAIELSGSGQTVTDSFSLGGFTTVVVATHDGESNFQARFIDSDGDRAASLVNVIGSYDGGVVNQVEADDYRIDINADGNWSFTIFQPWTPEENIVAPPTSASGTGPDVLGTVLLDGDHVISGSHDGDSNFQVHLHDEDGTGGFGDRELIFNEIGSFEGQRHTNMEGYMIVDVNADGHWELEID